MRSQVAPRKGSAKIHYYNIVCCSFSAPLHRTQFHCRYQHQLYAKFVKHRVDCEASAGSQVASSTFARRIHALLRYESSRIKWRTLCHHQRRISAAMGSSNHERTTLFVIVGMNRHQACHHNPKRTIKMSIMGHPPLLSRQHPLIAGGIGHLASLRGNENCRLLLPLLVSRGIRGSSPWKPSCAPRSFFVSGGSRSL